MSGYIIWEPTVRELRDNNSRARDRLKASLRSIQIQDSTYAREHRSLIVLYSEIGEVIDRHIEASGVVLPAPPEG